MKNILSFFLFLFLISCNQKEKKIPPSKIKETNIDTIGYLESTQKRTFVLEKKIKYPCKENKEIEFYYMYGKVRQTAINNIVCTYQNKLIKMKTVFVDCKVIARSVYNLEGGDSCGYSFVRYEDNRIITFDSVDINCNRIVSYVAGRIGKNDPLPSYLLKASN